MRRAILVVILLLLVGASTATVTILARRSQSDALASARGRQETLAKLTTANVELGLKTGDIKAIQDFLKSLQSDSAFAGGFLLDVDGDAILSVPSNFELSDEMLQRTLSQGTALEGDLAYRVAELIHDDEAIGHFLIALSEEQIHKDAAEALVFTAKIGLALLLPVTALIAWLLSWMEKQLQKGEKEIRKVSGELSLMLDNLGQGVLTFDTAGFVGPVHSRKANSMLGKRDLHGVHVTELLGSNQEEREEFEDWIKLVKEPRFLKRWEHYEKLNPLLERTLEHAGQARTLALEYKPVLEDEQLARILLLTTDITETRLAEDALERAREQRDIEVRELHSAFGTEPAILEQLVDVAKDTLREAEGLRSLEDLADPGGKLHRDLHTLKGNSGTLDFDTLASAAGDLEDVLAGVRSHPDPGDWEKWRQLLPGLAQAIEHLEGLREKRNAGSVGSLSVNRERFNAILGLLRADSLDGPEAATRLEALDSVPFGRCCTHYPRLLKSQAERLGRAEPELNIHGADQWVPRSLVPVFDTCLVHLIRNALAHGIEDDHVRATRGKSRSGRIEITAEIGEQWASLSVSDDGGGIDVERLVQKALAANHLSQADVAALGDQDKIDLVFRAGLSSRESVDELSGRGVGMDAVKHAVEQQGGTIAVQSSVGEGVEVSIRLPIRKPEMIRVDA